MQKYITDTFVLNPPKFNFSKLDDFKNEVIYIKKNEQEYIPCLFIQDINRCNKFLILFHGNNEHIFELEETVGFIREELKMNIIVVEYPGYSIYLSQKSPKMILDDSLIVYDYIKEKFNLNQEDIFIYGRSIGSAPSIYLASKREASALFVISGFSSLKNVGKGLWVGWAIEDIFKNVEYIANVSIPTLFIHGKKDGLISYEQTLELYNKSCSKIKEYIIKENMTHNDYNIKEDILNNIDKFLGKYFNIYQINDYYNLYNKKFDDMFVIPEKILKYLDNINFNLEGYVKYDKIFPNPINIIFLLKNERIALIFDNEIQICDTLNFNKFFSIKEKNKIIFADVLKNGDIIYCSNDAICNIIKIEFTSYIITKQFKIDNFGLNYCKIVEINDNSFVALLDSFSPLNIISENKYTKKYEYNPIEIFKSKSLNDVISIENNQIATTSIFESKVYIYNYLEKYMTDSFHVTNLIEKNHILLINYVYIILLCEDKIYCYDINNKNLFAKLFYIDYIQKYCFFEGKRIKPSIIKQYENILIFGDNEGKIIKINFEDKFLHEDEFVIIKSSEIFKFIDFPIKDIAIINSYKLLIQSKNNELLLYIK